MKYPKWFPYPSSWLNALLLAGLTGTSGYIIKIMFLDSLEMSMRSRNVGAFILIGDIAVLSPILIITFIHHLLHSLTSRYAPSLQAPEIGSVKGGFPTLFSWWEGLLGWTVMSISLLITLIVGTLIYFTVGLSLEFSQILGKDAAFQLSMGGTWLTCAAYLYHCFYLVEQRLMTARSDRRGSTVGKSVPQ
jgi:hypothetical protein